MIKTILQEFPITDYPRERSLSEEKIRKYAYTKEEVNVLIEAAVKEAVDEARRIDDESMAKHNRDATVISMILGFTTLALFEQNISSLAIFSSSRTNLQKLTHSRSF